MKKNIHKIILVLFLIVGLNVDAQQEAMYSQWALNMMSVNPGYAGYREVQSFSVLHRSQWVGYKGAPLTDVFAFDMALKNKALAVGGSIVNDKIGPSSEFGITGNFAYRLNPTLNSTLSLGVQAYGALYSANLMDLELVSKYVGGPVDQNFEQNPNNVFLPNFGAGAFFHTKNSFIGISSPKLLRNKLGSTVLDEIRAVDGRTEPTYFVNGGYTIDINTDLSIQPVAMFKGTQGAPLSMGGYLNFMVRDAFKIGVLYYHQEVAGALMELNLNHRMKLGYSFDVPINDLIGYNYGSHEISATYELRHFTKRLIYPRRF